MQPLPHRFDGSVDCTTDGVGRRDEAFCLGRRPTSLAPYPFSTQQYARLLVLRGRVRDGLYAADDLDA